VLLLFVALSRSRCRLKHRVTKIAQSCRYRQAHCRLTPTARGTPANIRKYLIFLETASLLYMFAVHIVRVYHHSNFYDGLRIKRIFFARVRIGRSRSSKVIDLGRVCDFLLVRHSNLGPTVHRLKNIAGFLHTLFHPNFGLFPLDQMAAVGVNPSTYIP